MDTLDRLAQATRQRIESGYYAGVASTDADRPRPSFVSAIERSQRTANRLAIVTEIKPASPSAGMLLQHPEREVAFIMDQYAQAGADGLSVLTDATHFGGSLSYLHRASETGLPRLMKDFLLAESQLEAARACGASAVLLILTLIRRAYAELALDDMIAAAHERDLEVLLEVNGSDEYAEALGTDADMIGINNRDLSTLRLDLATTERVLQRHRKDRPVWALSGVESRDEIIRMRQAGADAVLVGTSLMRSGEPGKSLRALLSS